MKPPSLLGGSSLTPLIDLKASQLDWLKGAKALGIKTGLCVFSWDNLTNKSLIQIETDIVLVWNEIQKYEAVEAMLEFGHKVSQHSDSHDLFADTGGSIKRVAPQLPDIPEWSNSDKLAQEKAMLGYYVSGHPLDKYRDELVYFTTYRIGDLPQVPDNREVTIGGIVTSVKRTLDKRGNTMAFVTVEDYSGSVELILFSDCYEKGKDHVINEKLVLVTGRVATREGEAPKIIGVELL